MIKNLYFKENISIELNKMDETLIPKILLIKDNMLIDKILRIFQLLFYLFSTNGKMSKEQSKELMK